VIRVLRIIARLNIGGPAIHATLLAERLDAGRFETMLVSGSEGEGEGSYLELQGRSIERLVRVPELGREIRGARDLRVLWSLIGLIRRYRPHVVHTHTAKAGTLGRMAAFVCRVPVVVHTYHGHVLRGYFPPLKSGVFTAIERGLARVTDRLVAVTAGVRDELVALGVGRPDQYAIVPLGFDLSRFENVEGHRAAFRSDVGVPDDAAAVSIVARLVPIKAHELFLEAARRVLALRPGAVFLVVGDGERRAALERLAFELGLESHVRFLGWRADLERVYAGSDIVALTSKNEGSPVALIEAMACGRAVVATRVGGVADVVSHGTTGLLVQPGDADALASAIARLVDDEELRRRLALSAREHAWSTYRAERLVSDIEGLYTALLADRRIGS
jgi:glycosyltransferase involved in cell wall biosynthesis